MSGMTVFVKRAVCLAAVVGFLFAAGVEAQTKYIVSAGSGPGQFTVKKGSYSVYGGTNVPLDTVMGVIRKNALGDPVEIHFDTAGGGVFVGTNSVVIKSDQKDSISWGEVTLSGALRSSMDNGGAVCFKRDIYDTTLDVRRSSLNIKVDGKGAGIDVGNGTRLVLDGCDLSVKSGDAVRSRGGSSEITIMSGKFKSESGNGVSVDQKLKIFGGTFESSTGRAVYCQGPNGTISGGDFSTKTGTVLDISNGGEIIGGVFKATEGGKALYVHGGTVRISGEADFITFESDTNATVVLSLGHIVLAGGFIENRRKRNAPEEQIGRAIEISSATSTLTFTGSTSPDIYGKIAYHAPGLIRMDVETSWKNYDRYKLEPLGGAKVDGAIAVVGGGGYVGSFDYDTKYYRIKEVGSDIIIELQKVEPLRYNITGDTVSGFTAVEYYSSDTIGKKMVFRELFDEIRNHADGKPCSLSLGISGSALNIGSKGNYNGGLSFGKVVGWGRVTLLGRLICKRPNDGPRGPTFGLYVTDGASVASYADINCIGHKGSVYVTSGSDFVNMGGTHDMLISNGDSYSNTSGGMVTIKNGRVPQITSRGKGAEVVISGGVIGDTAISECAVMNEEYSRINISKTAKIVSADTTKAGGTIINWGMLEISGGNVWNVRASAKGTSIAVNNGYNVIDTAIHPTVEISGMAEIYSRSRSDNTGVVYNECGKMTISGGNVYGLSDTSSAIVVNYDRLSISGSAIIKSSRYTIDGTAAVQTFFYDNDDVDIGLNISGGTITADSGYAVIADGPGNVVISDSAKITTARRREAVFVGPGTQLCLYGGKVSSRAAEKGDSTTIAIDHYAGGRGGAPGRLAMSGSPAVNGIISLPGGNMSPIRIIGSEIGAFNPPEEEIYRIAIPASDGGIAVENGAGFIHSFALVATDTGNVILNNLAVNGNDIVSTADRPYMVLFDLNGSTSDSTPKAIPVIPRGTIGELAKPRVNSYVKFKVVGDTTYQIENDGEWHIHNGANDGGTIVNNSPFVFGVGNDGERVEKGITLTLSWTGPKIVIDVVSVLESTRDIPLTRNTETAALAPAAATSGALTAGPSPVSSSSGGAVSFYRSGAALKSGKLFIYDASGNIVTKINVNDQSGGTGRRAVAKWNLQDAKGRQASEGTYVARGVITAKTGKTERVSVLINVQK